MLAGLLTSVVKNTTQSKAKKVDKEKLLPSAKGDKDQKALPGTAKPSSIVVRPKTSIARKIKVTNYKVASADGGGGRGGALSYDSIANRLDALVKNTNTLSQIAKDQYNSEVSKNAAERIRDQRDAQNLREEKAERKEQVKTEKKGFGLKMPQLDIFQGLFGTLQRLAFSTAVMQFLYFFSDPEKTKPIFDFLDKHFTAIVIGTIGALGTLVLLPLLGPGSIMLSAIGMIGSLAMTLGGLAVSVALSPGGRLILAAMALRGLYYSNAGGVRGFLEGTMLKAIAVGLRMKYGDANFQKGSFTTKLRDNYGQIASQAERDKMTAEEKNTARLLEMYDKELQKKDKADPKKLKMLEEQIEIQGKPLSFWYSRFTQHGMDGLPQTSLSRRLYKDNAKAADALNQSLKAKAKPSPKQSKLPALPPTGTVHGQAYGASRAGGSRKHAGTDFDISGNETFYSRIGGEVTYIGYDPNGYGNYVDIYNADLDKTERIAEGERVLVSKGDMISPGQAVVQGESNTGVIHYEIRQGRKTTYGYLGTEDPISFLESQKVKDVIASVSSSASYEPGAPVVVAAPQPPASASGGGAKTSLSGSILPSSQDPNSQLNSYYRNVILGALSRQ